MIWWYVKHLALYVDILENLLLIMWFERQQDFAVRTELEIDGDLERAVTIVPIYAL